MASRKQLALALAWATGDEIRLGCRHPFPHDAVCGTLALALDRIDEAEAHFRSGVEWWEQEGVEPLLGQYLQGLAEVAERRGEREQAMEHFDRAGALLAATARSSTSTRCSRRRRS